MATRGRPTNLNTWINRQLAAGCTSIKIHRGKIDGTPGQRIEQIKLEPNEDADRIAESIESETQSDVETIGAQHKYVLVSYIGSESHAQRVLVAIPSDDSGEQNNSSPSEGPSANGLVGQLMRHLEKRDIMLQGLVTMIAADATNSKREDKEVLREYRKLAMSGLKAQKELATGDKDRDLANAEMQLEMANLEQRERGIMLAASLVGKLMGVPVGEILAGMGQATPAALPNPEVSDTED